KWFRSQYQLAKLKILSTNYGDYTMLELFCYHLPVTMSAYVPFTIALNPPCSDGGTLHLSGVC
ncbi:MAG TPA: hypothetical protein VFP47_19130, partial [Pyrinomonadaceae bacterium]|nr:hypothetical protein [Pyrinomonadaceae bacterium]